jgi:hypothetical protein
VHPVRVFGQTSLTIGRGIILHRPLFGGIPPARPHAGDAGAGGWGGVAGNTGRSSDAPPPPPCQRHGNVAGRQGGGQRQEHRTRTRDADRSGALRVAVNGGMI